MNPTQITADSLVVKSEIDGITEITISDWKPNKIGQSRAPTVYNGLVKSGTGSSAVGAHIFCYKVLDTPQMLHKQCSAINHPNVMRSLGYGRGSKEYTDHMFIAFPIFEKTFSDYTRKASGATEMGRFSAPFIEIARDIVNGMVALSRNGFGCPKLTAAHIAIVTEGNSLTAKIWNFSKCNSDGQNYGWFLLGGIFYDIMNNNFASNSLEIKDISKKMVNGKLKGIAILKQSALLTVREKFDNVLVLWSHVSIHCKQGQGLPQRGGQGTSQEGHILEEYLDLGGTIAPRPQWIDNIRSGRQPRSFRELLDELRDIIEHEIEYIPPSEDLEYWFRKAWEKDFLKIQLWATNPKRKIKED